MEWLVNTIEFYMNFMYKRRTKTLSSNYPNYEFAGVHKENYWGYLGQEN